MWKAVLEVLVVEILPRIDHRFLTVNLFQKSGHECHTISELLRSPILAFFHVDYGYEVLFFWGDMTDKIEELEPHATRGAHEVITPHLQPTTARLLEVVLVSRVLIGATLCSFDVNELKVLVTRHVLPIYFPLMVRNVNAVAAAHGGGVTTAR